MIDLSEEGRGAPPRFFFPALPAEDRFPLVEEGADRLLGVRRLGGHGLELRFELQRLLEVQAECAFHAPLDQGIGLPRSIRQPPGSLARPRHQLGGWAAAPYAPAPAPPLRPPPT